MAISIVALTSAFVFNSLLLIATFGIRENHYALSNTDVLTNELLVPTPVIITL